MSSTFTWNVEANPSLSKRPQVSNIKFGDGYSQRVSKGLNTLPHSWQVAFNSREESEASAIDAFLSALLGVDYFLWTPPGELSPKKFICQEWEKVIGNGGLHSISARFEEVFDP